MGLSNIFKRRDTKPKNQIIRFTGPNLFEVRHRVLPGSAISFGRDTAVNAVVAPQRVGISSIQTILWPVYNEIDGKAGLAGYNLGNARIAIYDQNTGELVREIENERYQEEKRSVYRTALDFEGEDRRRFLLDYATGREQVSGHEINPIRNFMLYEGQTAAFLTDETERASDFREHNAWGSHYGFRSSNMRD